MKKLVSLGLATVMALSMAVPTFATELTSADLASENLNVVAGTLSDVAYNEFEITAGDEVEAQGASSVVVLDAEPTIFKAIVPIALHVEQAADTTKTYRDAMTADNAIGAAKIANLSPMGQIQVTDVDIITAPGYTISAWDADYNNMKVNTKTFGFKLNGLDAATDGSLNGFGVGTKTITSAIVDAEDGKTDMTRVYADYTFTREDNNEEAFPIIAYASVLPIDYEAKLPAFSAAVENTNIGAVVFTLDFNTAA